MAASLTCGSNDSVNGLKFGMKIYFEDVTTAAGGGVGGSSSKGSSSVTAKKGKGVVQGVQQAPRCQVEGCNVDLSDVKAYYSRHKVCAIHSKSPKVIVAGLEQRFCQQCSRLVFFSLFFYLFIYLLKTLLLNLECISLSQMNHLNSIRFATLHTA